MAIMPVYSHLNIFQPCCMLWKARIVSQDSDLQVTLLMPASMLEGPTRLVNKGPSGKGQEHRWPVFYSVSLLWRCPWLRWTSGIDQLTIWSLCYQVRKCCSRWLCVHREWSLVNGHNLWVASFSKIAWKKFLTPPQSPPTKISPPTNHIMMYTISTSVNMMGSAVFPLTSLKLKAS